MQPGLASSTLAAPHWESASSATAVEGLQSWSDWLLSMASAGQVPSPCSEVRTDLSSDALIGSGFVVYAINPKHSTDYATGSCRGGKDDRRNAYCMPLPNARDLLARSRLVSPKVRYAILNRLRR